MSQVETNGIITETTEEPVVDTKAVELTNSLNGLTKSFADLSNNLTAKSNALNVSLSTSVNTLINNLTKSFIVLANKIDGNNVAMSEAINKLSVSSSNSFSALDTTLAERDESINTLVKAFTEIVKSKKDKEKTTRIISLKDYRAANAYSIINAGGKGRIKEVTIVCPVKFNIHVVADNRKISNLHYSFDDLTSLTGYSDFVSATAPVGGNYIVSVKDIFFNKNIEISIDFDGSIVIENIWCIYDMW